MRPLGASREPVLVFFILAMAFALRVWGIGFGLPYLYHADEPIVVNHALAYGTGDLHPHFFKIPPLISYLLSVCYGIYYVLGRGTGSFRSLGDFERLFYFDPSSFYLIARLAFGVLLGVASVYMLYLLVKRFWDARTGLWAGLFLAVNFLHARDSHYIYADIPLVLAFLAGFFVFFRMAQDPRSLKWHMISGAVIGLATATKYNGVFLAVAYIGTCFQNVPWKRWLPSWGLAVLTAAGTFVLLNPYAVLDLPFFLKELAEQSAANQGSSPWFHYLTYSLAGAIGWPGLLLALWGLLRGVLGKAPRSRTMAVFLIVYYAVLCRFGQPYDRYALPLIPFMMIFAAEVLLAVKGRSRFLFWVLVPLVAVPPLVKTVFWDRLMAATDIRTAAKTWAEGNIPDGTRIALDGVFYMPRLAFTPSQLEGKRSRAAAGSQADAKIRRVDALLSDPFRPSYELYFLSKDPGGPGFLFGEPKVPFDLNLLRQKGIQFVFLIEAHWGERDPFLQELRRGADRIAMFSPYRDPADLTIRDPLAMTGGPFLWKDIIGRERNGYPFSVYRIRS